MDTGSVPALSVWEILVDGVPDTASAQAWFDATHLRVHYTGVPPISAGIINLIATDPGLRCTFGAVAKAPQSDAFFP